MNCYIGTDFLYPMFDLCTVTKTKIPISHHSHFNPSRSSRRAQNDMADIELPADLIRLEAHFEKPPRVHNDDRRRREELSKLHTDLSDPEKCAEMLQSALFDGSVFVLERVTELPHGWRKITVQKETVGVNDAVVVGVEQLSLEDSSRAGDLNCFYDYV